MGVAHGQRQFRGAQAIRAGHADAALGAVAPAT
jgi:hypothetical protein